LGAREGMGSPGADEGGGGAYSRPNAPASRPAPPNPRAPAAAQAKPSSGFDDMDDDIPF
jgi:single-strand DNA-binding protein